MSDNQSENEKDGGTFEIHEVTVHGRIVTFVYSRPAETEAERRQRETQPPPGRPRNDADSGSAGASGHSRHSHATVSAPSNAPSTQQSIPSEQSRRGRACDRCHTGKRRCNMTEGAPCQSCRRSSVECKPYEPSAARKGPSRTSCNSCRDGKLKCVKLWPDFACEQCCQTGHDCSFGQAKPACSSCALLNLKCEKGPGESCSPCFKRGTKCSHTGNLWT